MTALSGAEVCRELLKLEILVDGRPMAGVRMSPPFYNTDRELEAAISAVEEILKDRDRLLDHESLVRQVRHNPLDNKECGEAEDRKPPGVSYHYVILIWQSLIPGNIEKELHESSEQRRATVVDIDCPARSDEHELPFYWAVMMKV